MSVPGSPIDRSGNQDGQAIAMTAVSEPSWFGRRVWLPVLFAVTARVPALTRTLRDLRFIHAAHWTILPSGRMLFVSNFNGGWREYIATFAEELTRGMRLFWGTSEGFPGPLPVEPFLAYIDGHEYGSEFYFSAYPDANTADVEAALARVGHNPTGRVSSFTSLMPEGVLPAGLSRESFEGTGAHFARFVILPEGLLFTAVHDDTRTEFVERLVTAGVVADPAGLLAGEVKLGLFYAAYHATVQEVRDALERFPPDDEEWTGTIPGERLHIDRTLDRLMAKQGNARCQHAATVPPRVVAATFVPLPERREWCKSGMLERHGEHPCKVRFSMEGRALGMSVVFGDDRWSDLALATGRAFFCRDAEEVSEFQKRRAEGKTLRFFVPSLNPRRWRLRGLHNLAIAGRLYPWTRRREPLAETYCSLVAFDHGSVIVRWLARPDLEGFTLCAQPRTHPEKMPVEDARVPWSEKLSPWQPVATIVLGEEIDDDGLAVRLQGSQGSVGRARETIYPALQEKRLAASKQRG